jgi:hypothetical protein
VRNIRSIFHHKYGEQTEFWGYFDKFFTVSPFVFDNKKAVSERIPYLLQQIKYEDTGMKDALREDGIVKHLLEEVLVRAWDMGSMDLRQLYKPIQHLFPVMEKSGYQKGAFLDARNLFIDIAIKLLIALYGDKDSFLSILKKIRDDSSEEDKKAQWLYDMYANSMLRHMLVLNPDDSITWLKKHPVIATQDENHSNRVNIRLQSKQANARFFYDTFVEYVDKGKYDKKNIHEYE